MTNGLPTPKKLSKSRLQKWNKWVTSRPEKVREMCEKLPFWFYYKIPKTGQIVIIQAYAEDGTVRVLVVGDKISIPAIVQFEVFGVHASDLVKWEPDSL